MEVKYAQYDRWYTVEEGMPEDFENCKVFPLSSFTKEVLLVTVPMVKNKFQYPGLKTDYRVTTIEDGYLRWRWHERVQDDIVAWKMPSPFIMYSEEYKEIE